MLNDYKTMDTKSLIKRLNEATKELDEIVENYPSETELIDLIRFEIAELTAEIAKRAGAAPSTPSNGVQASTVTTQSVTLNTPRCPTCQSTNIKKISSSRRLIAGFTYILSPTAHSQFECKNCGYKW